MPFKIPLQIWLQTRIDFPELSNCSFATITWPRVPPWHTYIVAVACSTNNKAECILLMSQSSVRGSMWADCQHVSRLNKPLLGNISSTLLHMEIFGLIKNLCVSGHLEFHSTFCLSLRPRKPWLIRVDTQGLTLWKSHWKVRKLDTEMVRISWLNGSMATQLRCGGTEKERRAICKWGDRIWRRHQKAT